MRTERRFYSSCIALCLALLVACAIQGASAAPIKEVSNDPAATEVWTPRPKAVSVPKQQNFFAPPSDAQTLIDKTLAKWKAADSGKSAPWLFRDDVLQVVPGSGDIVSKETFCDVQLHLEWRSVPQPNTSGQNRGNSGLFLQQRYEVQILDSYNSDTYANGQAGSIYKQSSPLVNASAEPGVWQSYDIIFKAPRFDDDKLVSPAYITVLHNGVLVQNHFEIKGSTTYIGEPEYAPHTCDAIRLQDHGAVVEYRNIWVRSL